jgi:hypothetical protein
MNAAVQKNTPCDKLTELLTAGTQVRLMESAGGWVLVARDSKKLGYVDAKAILALQ